MQSPSWYVSKVELTIWRPSRALTRHVAVATARVAGLLAGTAVATTAGVATTVAATIAAAGLGAVAGNVTDLTALLHCVSTGRYRVQDKAKRTL